MAFDWFKKKLSLITFLPAVLSYPQDSCDMSATRKTVAHLVRPQTRPHWVGDGFNVYPLFNELAFEKELSPFLMFDYAPPKNFPPTSKKLGVGMHPHRGFETVTIALEGEVEHKDDQGNTGIIGTGDVQWMTAGNGIFHEEFHSRAFAKKGGPFSMMQLWVNLPARLKMVPPRYQEITAEEIPVVTLPDGAGTLRLISGDYDGVKGAANTDFVDEKGESRRRGEIILWELLLEPGQSHELKVTDGHTTLFFVRSGALIINGDTDSLLEMPRLALMTRKGTSVLLTSAAETGQTSVFVLGGEPHLDSTGKEEAIVQYGPMVMNTRKEIQEAMQWAAERQREMYS